MKTSTPDAPAKLVVLAPNWLGDAVMALPLIADVQRAWPQTEIAIAARRPVVPLFEMVPRITHTVTLAGGGGLRALRNWQQNVQLLAAGGFDAALLLPNSFAAAWVVSRARIPERWGIARDLRHRLLTRAIARPGKDLHQADYYQAIGAGLGISPGPRYARIDPSGDDRRRAAQLLRESGIGENRTVVAMAPGAAYGRAKQWLPRRFAELATLLEGREAVTVLVGAGADAPVCREIATRSAAIDLSGRTDLPMLAALFQHCAAVVANDSGAMHLAGAVGARVIAIFGATNERKTSPLRASEAAPEPRVVATSVWCRPCMLRECPIDHRCMTRISAQDVLEALGT